MIDGWDLAVASETGILGGRKDYDTSNAKSTPVLLLGPNPNANHHSPPPACPLASGCSPFISTTFTATYTARTTTASRAKRDG